MVLNRESSSGGGGGGEPFGSLWFYINLSTLLLQTVSVLRVFSTCGTKINDDGTLAGPQDSVKHATLIIQ